MEKNIQIFEAKVNTIFITFVLQVSLNLFWEKRESNSLKMCKICAFFKVCRNFMEQWIHLLLEMIVRIICYHNNHNRLLYFTLQFSWRKHHELCLFYSETLPLKLLWLRLSFSLWRHKIRLDWTENVLLHDIILWKTAQKFNKPKIFRLCSLSLKTHIKSNQPFPLDINQTAAKWPPWYDCELLTNPRIFLPLLFWDPIGRTRQNTSEFQHFF